MIIALVRTSQILGILFILQIKKLKLGLAKRDYVFSAHLRINLNKKNDGTGN